jgi:hypothetical protein
MVLVKTDESKVWLLSCLKKRQETLREQNVRTWNTDAAYESDYAGSFWSFRH